MTLDENSADGPLFEQEPLATNLKPYHPIREFRHWLIFSVAAFVGGAPILAGLVVGIAAIVETLRFPTLYPLWGLAVGTLILLLCFASLLIILYSIAGPDRQAGTVSIWIAVTAWPAMALAITILSVTAPNSMGISSSEIDHKSILDFFVK